MQVSQTEGSAAICGVDVGQTAHGGRSLQRHHPVSFKPVQTGYKPVQTGYKPVQTGTTNGLIEVLLNLVKVFLELVKLWLVMVLQD